MALTRKWSITLAGFFSIAMLAALLSLVTATPTQAMSRDGEIQHDPPVDFNPYGLPPIDFTIPITCLECVYGLDLGPVVGDTFGANFWSDSEGRADGQTSLQLSSGSHQLIFEAVNKILRDVEQNPTGVVVRGHGFTSGSSFDFTYTIRQPRGQCCSVEILAPELHPSGGVRFETPGALRFE